MSIYKNVFSNQLKSAFRWIKNGDHPDDYIKDLDGLKDGKKIIYTAQERREKNWEGEVVRYYRHPYVSGKLECPHCGKTRHEHGWIDKTDTVVCPGDIILEFPGETYYPIKPELYKALFAQLT